MPETWASYGMSLARVPRITTARYRVYNYKAVIFKLGFYYVGLIERHTGRHAAYHILWYQTQCSSVISMGWYVGNNAMKLMTARYLQHHIYLIVIVMICVEHCLSLYITILWHRNALSITCPLWEESIGHRWITLTTGQLCGALLFSIFWSIVYPR